MLKVFES